jgi:cytochrome c oxidase cbb3-type subunit 3
MNETTTKQSDAVQTTGHAWDGDLQEFNNPLPRWWLWTFYATVVFAIIYWVIYPSWPVGDTWLKGTKTVDVMVAGEQQEVSWNTRYRLLHELQSGGAATLQQEYVEKIAAAGFDQIHNNADMLAFARSVGRGLFGDNCAACHGRGGQGVVSMYPNLADDDWLWGGTMEQIQQTLIHGRNGFMPAFNAVLSDEQLDDVTEYVLTLSGEVQGGEASERGREIFQGKAGGCYYCHGATVRAFKPWGPPI